MTVTATQMYSTSRFNRSIEKSERLEREFFSMIRSKGKINKTTWGGRLADVDESLESYLNENNLSPYQFLDVGVSSGISTWDWCRKLKRSNRSFKMVATDILLHAYLIPVYPYLRVLSDTFGTPLQYDFFGYGVRPGRPRPRDWVNGTVLISSFMKFIYHRYLHRVGLNSESGTPINFSSKIEKQPSVRAIKLVSPRVLDSNEISLVEDDLLQPVPHEMKNQFNVIRAANILNYSYFKPDELLEISRRLKQCMVGPDSLLLVCRTKSDGSNHGTIFRLSSEAKLVPAKRVGGGSEIEAIVSQA